MQPAVIIFNIDPQLRANLCHVVYYLSSRYNLNDLCLSEEDEHNQLNVMINQHRPYNMHPNSRVYRFMSSEEYHESGLYSTFEDLWRQAIEYMGADDHSEYVMLIHESLNHVVLGHIRRISLRQYQSNRFYTFADILRECAYWHRSID